VPGDEIVQEFRMTVLVKLDEHSLDLMCRGVVEAVTNYLDADVISAAVNLTDSIELG
jgi:hypothetical protein